MRDANEPGVRRSSDIDLTTCTLPDFAAAVHGAVARVGHSTALRFGVRKVFIAAVRDALAGSGMTIAREDFAARLMDASRRGLLSLARADLVAAMPTASVAASEICDGRCEYHFVIDAGARETWVAAPSTALRPFCQICGWRKGGRDSWDGKACKCGLSAQPDGES